MDGRMDGRTAGTDTSDRVALDALTTVTDRGAVEAELQGRAAAVTAGKKQQHKNHIITSHKDKILGLNTDSCFV